MKQLLIAIAMVLAVSMNAGAVAQKHRHTPRTEQVDSTKNNQGAIEAFSDTTATNEDAEDDEYVYVSEDPEKTVHNGHYYTLPLYSDDDGEIEIIYQYANYMHHQGGFIQNTVISASAHTTTTFTSATM